MKLYVLIFAMVLIAVAGQVWAAQPVNVVLTCHITNIAKEYVPAEGNAAIMNAKKEHPDLGGSVYIYLHNQSRSPVTVKGVSWDGMGIKAHLSSPDYGVMWWRSAPATIAPGTETEITINLRESLKKDTTFTVDLGDAGSVDCLVKYDYSGPRLATVAFAPDLHSAYLYVEVAAGKFPADVYLNGKSARRITKLIGDRTTTGLALFKISPSAGFKQGERYLFRIGSGGLGCAGSLRAFGDLTRYGTYGFADAKGYSAAGFDAYGSFTAFDARTLDDHGASGVKAAMIIGLKPPDPSIVGNPNIYSYLAMDEPDCYDYSRDEKRPMHKRLGTYGQELADWGEICEKVDPLTPTKTTIDLTFAPQNYFTYAKVADLANPDCYTVTLGWPLTAFRDKASIIKRAAAPQPFTMTYQGCWEEWINPIDSWAGPTQIIEKGSENMVNRTSMRGFGRAPSPEEARIPMLYGIGGGARGLFCYTASTEAFGTMMFHNVKALPEVWQAVTRTTRELRTIAPLIQLSHPTIWGKSNRSSLWVRTLVCGEQAALVVVVNEACKSVTDSFIPSPVLNTMFSFLDLPWLNAQRVYRLGDGRLELVKSGKSGSTLNWTVDSINDGEIYLLCADRKLADKLIKEYVSKSIYIAQDGLKAPAEGYLKGRRKTPRQ